MNKSEWVAVASKLPGDGQVVLVKATTGDVEQRVQFFANPIPRWQSDDHIYGLKVYAYWRPLPSTEFTSPML